MRTITAWFWALSLAFVVMFAFFLALGAFDPGDTAPITILAVSLAALWGFHAWWMSRHKAKGRDPALVRARERRGF